MNAPLRKGEVSTGVPNSSKRGSEAKAEAKQNVIEQLLKIEADIRKTPNVTALKYLLVNEVKKLIGCDQAVLHVLNRKQQPIKIENVSSMATVDPNAPLLIWLNAEIAENATKPNDDGEQLPVRLQTEKAPSSVYPHPYVLYLPLNSPAGKNFSAISFLKSRPFQPQEVALAKRIMETSSHAWCALKPQKFRARRIFTKPISALMTVVAILALFIPVPLTVLAPAEVVPYKPKIVAAPLSGVLETIEVLPNKVIEQGQQLFSFNKVELLSRFEIANKEVGVAQAKYNNAVQGSFRSNESKREIAGAKAELAVAIAKREFANSQLQQADVVAEKSGVILFTGVENWLGKPVDTGERIMKIADPSQIRLKIEVDVADSIILENGAEVKIFLDANPLEPVKAVLESQSYQAVVTDRNFLAFPLTAKVQDGSDTPLRIGLRGTAQVKGEDVPLWFYLFRKPISYVRQLFGI